MPYLYVLQAPEYAKLGRTNDPKARIVELARDIGHKVHFTHVWECIDGAYKQVEGLAKRMTARFERLTPERVYTTPNNLAEIIEEAASKLDAQLKDVTNEVQSMEYRRRGHRLKTIQFRVSDDWWDWLESVMDKLGIEENKSELSIKAIEAFMEHNENDLVQTEFFEKELIEKIDAIRSKVPVPTRRIDLLRDAWNKYAEDLDLP